MDFLHRGAVMHEEVPWAFITMFIRDFKQDNLYESSFFFQSKIRILTNQSMSNLDVVFNQKDNNVILFPL